MLLLGLLGVLCFLYQLDVLLGCLSDHLLGLCLGISEQVRERHGGELFKSAFRLVDTSLCLIFLVRGPIQLDGARTEDLLCGGEGQDPVLAAGGQPVFGRLQLLGVLLQTVDGFFLRLNLALHVTVQLR